MTSPAAPPVEPLEAAWQAGSFDEVARLATLALAAAPGDARALAWLALAEAAQGAPAASATLVRACAALRAAGPDEAPLHALATRFLQLGHGHGPEAARFVVERLQLEHPASLRALAAAAVQEGDAAEGVALLRRALAEGPQEPESHYQLARLLARLDKRPNVIRHLRAALAHRGGHLAVRRLARAEPDFDALRADADFQELLDTLPHDALLRPLYAALDRGELERVAALAPGLLAMARNPLDVLLPWREALERLAEGPFGEVHAAALAAVEARLAPHLVQGERSLAYLVFRGEL
jgi:tetratricopeptide (TPR) repeat protein